jgi:hypothetical protein
MTVAALSDLLRYENSSRQSPIDFSPSVSSQCIVVERALRSLLQNKKDGAD